MLRVNILASNLPLCMIHQIMRMPKNILNFLIMVVMISILIQLITMLIHSLLICLSHFSLMIYLLKKWKPRRLSKHFSLRLWLSQALTVLRLVPLLIRKFEKLLRLLITHLYALNINPIHKFRFLHRNHMIPSPMHWRNHSEEPHLQGISCLFFSCFLVCRD